MKWRPLQPYQWKSQSHGTAELDVAHHKTSMQRRKGYKKLINSPQLSRALSWLWLWALNEAKSRSFYSQKKKNADKTLTWCHSYRSPIAGWFQSYFKFHHSALSNRSLPLMAFAVFSGFGAFYWVRKSFSPRAAKAWDESRDTRKFHFFQHNTNCTPNKTSQFGPLFLLHKQIVLYNNTTAASEDAWSSLITSYIFDGLWI